MSIRKPKAPRLLPILSNRRCCSSSGTCSVCRRSTFWRMRTMACEAWSSPRTDSTPRICDKCAATGASTAVSAGLRKYWSSSFSASARVPRNSPTTLPMVCWSLTWRYSCSIQGSSGWAGCPASTCSRRPAKVSACEAIASSARSSEAKAACRYSTAVATSIATSGDGGWAWVATLCTTCIKALARDRLPGCSLTRESQTRVNWSTAGLHFWTSPPARADQTSVAVAIRLRAWASRWGSKRPNRGCS